MKVLITGSGGLIGSQAVDFFYKKGFDIIGVDNDMRSYFFGQEGSNKSNIESLKKCYARYEHHSLDIRDYKALEEIFKKNKIDIVIHTAAQPSHDWACKEPLTDFSVNANGTLNLLELTRNYCKDSTFIFTSTNKVYGDRPNFSYENKAPDSTYKNLFIKEKKNRYEACFYSQEKGWQNDASIDETMPIDNSKHSIFGASKVAADIMCQEYGKYFDMNVGVFRGGCLTGPHHSGVELHGFLSYLIKCVKNNKHYKIFGYKGKQVRDNIHSFDLVNMFWHFHDNPKKGEVYNVGGGKENAISILEAIKTTNLLLGVDYDNFSIQKENREGDHIWYISDLSKFKSHFPNWSFRYSLIDVIKQILASNK